jgi:D-glycero-beta-D-manno-heptose-7-phosphate kinase
VNAAELRGLLERVGGGRVLVVGDLYLDHYIFGQPSRISREAPIMVLDEARREDRLGGGAAPALALRALGCEVALAGVVGDDAEGQRVRALLAEAGIAADGVVTDRNRPTTTKTRIVAEGFLLFPQQLVRLDRQQRAAMPAPVEDALCATISVADHDAILVSDYRSGVVTAGLVRAIQAARAARQTLATVDSQGELEKFAAFDLLKCNQAEAERVLGGSLGDYAQRSAALGALRERLGGGALVVTRGGDGAALATPAGYAEVAAVNRSEIFDVTGAGDTVVAVMTAALLAGADVTAAAQLAQVAAGLVVRKWGNAQATRVEIAGALED